jgi:hypothetical protein
MAAPRAENDAAFRPLSDFQQVESIASRRLLAQRANKPGWWSSCTDVVPSWFQRYLALEQAASLIRNYGAMFVPDLLQTEDYARAVLRFAHRRGAEDRLERCVSLRIQRQRILYAAGPPRVWAIVDEAALRRMVGGAAVIRGQIRHLIDLAELPHVTVGVLPLQSGVSSAVGVPIGILRFHEDVLPDVVYLEQLTTAVYPDRPADVDFYLHAMNCLVVEAETPEASIAHLHRMFWEI